MAPSSPSPRKKVLFVSPAKPMKGGYGMTMRAGNHVDVLSQAYDVSILLVNQDRLLPHYQSLKIDVPEWEKWCVELRGARRDAIFARLIGSRRNSYVRVLIDMLRPALFGVPGARACDDALSRFAGDGLYDAIFAYKLFAAPIAWALRDRLRSPRAPLILDTDDVESDAVRSFADASRRSLGRVTYFSRRVEAWKLRVAESKWFRRFDRVFVCSEQDRGLLAARYPDPGDRRFRVMPNVVRFPAAPLPWPEEGALNLLFVGTMSYAANVDAALFFCDSILPLLRRGGGPPFRVWFVGRNPPAQVKNLERANPEVTVTGTVPDVAEFYARAQLVIVPLRMGGGTRIKILEAMGYGRPVVSTTIGAEGLDFSRDEEIAIADDPQAFAEQCLRLMRDPAVARRIAASALERCRALYTLEGLKARLAGPIETW